MAELWVRVSVDLGRRGGADGRRGAVLWLIRQDQSIVTLILWGSPHGLAVSAAPLVGDCELRAKNVMGWGVRG